MTHLLASSLTDMVVGFTIVISGVGLICKFCLSTSKARF